MRIVSCALVALLLSACASQKGAQSKTFPPVKVDVSKLQMLPAGAGYTMLNKETADTLNWMRASQSAAAVEKASKGICHFDVVGNTINTPSGAHSPGNMEVFAYHVQYTGKMAELARSRGHSLLRTVVIMRKSGSSLQGDLCVVTGIDEGNRSPDEVAQELVRIFTASRQVGVQLSCYNIKDADC